MTMHPTYRMQKGAALIEIALWLAVVVGLVSGIAWLASTASVQKQTYAALGNMQAISTAMNRVYGAAQKISGAPYVGVTNAQVIPLLSSDIVAQNTLRSAFGGNITLSAGNSFGTPGDSYVMQFDGVPAGACTEFINKLVGLATAISVSSPVTRPVVVLSPGGTAPTGAQIATACASSSQNGAMSIAITEI